MIDATSSAQRGIPAVAAPSAAAPEARADVSARPPAPPAADELVLSEAARQSFAASEGEFDAARVAALQEAIRAGNYPLDSRRIAESFVALERMLGGAGA